MLQTGKNGGYERLQDFFLFDAAQKSQGGTSEVLIGMLEIVSEILTDEDLQAVMLLLALQFQC